MKSSPPLHPPALLLRLFKWFCRPEYHEDIEGDLIELFMERGRERSHAYARFRMWGEVLWLFRPGIIRPLFTTTHPYINHGMLTHNFLITYRSFLRNKRTFLINLLGLSAGLTSALLIFLWVQDERNMDAFHENDDQFYQVMQVWDTPYGDKVYSASPGPLAAAMLNEFPEVKFAAASKYTPEIYDGFISIDEQKFKATPQYAGPNFFDIFTFPIKYGDTQGPLTDKYATVISESLAQKLFSQPEKAIGKTITWEKKFGEIVDFGGDFMVTGVFEDIPMNSSLKFDVVFTYDFYREVAPSVDLWTNDQADTHILINKDANIEELNTKISALVASHRDYEFRGKFFLQKYSDKYLFGSVRDGAKQGSGRIVYVRLFSLIAFLILLIACINFMNLSTARASIRIKEIGVKKTLGARRGNLIIQFVTESLIISVLALGAAVLLAALLLPQFNQITGKQLQLGLSFAQILSLLAIAGITGLISSIYPALYLSGFDAIQVLKGKLPTSFGEFWVRKGLVVFQFAVSVILIVAVWVIHRQMAYIQHKNLGFDRENIITLKREGALTQKLDQFFAEVRALPQVVSATNSNNSLVGFASWTGGFFWEGRPENFTIDGFVVNYDYLQTFDIQLKEGRDFSRDLATDTAKIIINESTVQAMGLTDPIGATANLWGQDVEIIGVVEDFQYHSMYRPVGPCLFKLFNPSENMGDKIWVKMKPGMEEAAIAGISGIYKRMNPGYPFEYGFVDQQYQAMYESETRTANLSKYFAGLAILISCLGLFGLTVFTARRRAKEISIRKILGSSMWNIVILLSRDFNLLLLVAIGIAIPISYFMARNWLGEFAYKIDLHWGFFVGAAGITLLIAWLTVGIQTLKTAYINPVEYLRDE